MTCVKRPDIHTAYLTLTLEIFNTLINKLHAAETDSHSASQ